MKGDRYCFTIPGIFPNLNTIIEASKEHWAVYKEMKQIYTDKVVVALIDSNLPQFDKIDLTITWVERNKKRDKDGIMAGLKFILDGLVKRGNIKNDGWEHIRNINNIFIVDKENPCVEVTITEV